MPRYPLLIDAIAGVSVRDLARELPALLAELEEMGARRLGWAGNRGRRALSRLSVGDPDPLVAVKQSISGAGAR